MRRIVAPALGLALGIAGAVVPAAPASAACAVSSVDVTLLNTGVEGDTFMSYEGIVEIAYSPDCTAVTGVATFVSPFATPTACVALNGGCTAYGLAGIPDGRIQVAFVGAAVSPGSGEVPVTKTCSLVLNPSPGGTTHC